MILRRFVPPRRVTQTRHGRGERVPLINLTLLAHVTRQPRNTPGENIQGRTPRLSLNRKRTEAEHDGLVGRLAAGRDYPALKVVAVVGPCFH